MSTTDKHLIPSDLALAIWSLTMQINGLILFHYPQYTRVFMGNSGWRWLSFILFCLNIDIQHEVISLFSYSIKADTDFTLPVLLVSCVKRYRWNKMTSYWFENRTHSKIGVRFYSIAKPNRTPPIIRLSSAGYLFPFVRLNNPGIRQITGISDKILRF